MAKAKSQRVSPKATSTSTSKVTRRSPTIGKPARQARPAEKPVAPAPVARARQASATPRAPVAATEQTQVGYKVRAIEKGYYDHAIRRVGDVFLIADPSHFSENWMEYVDASTPERISTAQQAIRKANVETATARMPGAVMPLVHDEPSTDGGKNPLGA